MPSRDLSNKRNQKQGGKLALQIRLVDDAERKPDAKMRKKTPQAKRHYLQIQSESKQYPYYCPCGNTPEFLEHISSPDNP